MSQLLLHRSCTLRVQHCRHRWFCDHSKMQWSSQSTWCFNIFTILQTNISHFYFIFTFCLHRTEWKKCEMAQHSRALLSIPSSSHSNTSMNINVNIIIDYVTKKYTHFGELEMLSKTIHGSSSLYSMVPSAPGRFVPLLVVQKLMFRLICCCSI